MLFRGMAVLQFGFLCGTLSAQPRVNMDAIRKDFQDRLEGQMRQGQIWNMPSRQYPESEPSGEGFFAAHFTVFAKGGQRQGYAALRYRPGNDSKGVAGRYHLEMDGARYFPDMTDSILVFGETGYPEEDGWLFRKVAGRIAAYTAFPLGPVSAISVDGGKRRPLKKKLLDSLLMDSPIAYAHAEADPEFAIRVHNRYSGIDRRTGGDMKLADLRRIFLADSLGGWEIAKLKKATADDPIEMILLARYHCQKGKVSEGRELLEKLKPKLPDFYSVLWAEASCLEQEGRTAEALEKLRLARGKSPDDRKLTESLSGRIDILKRALARNPGARP